ncbi:hypothetical protein [Prevotella jejuni]|jgi:hypothetical protein|uniref:hypothetical protein n=1 Tax=Prevotella jejuni TaxID=1177574 RepID=UPI0028E91EB4|nr:hypothetical protein [Prevotella jejuni]
MKVLFPTSGNGDCIFCLADKEDGTYFSIMVDCHIFTQEIKAIVTDTLHSHLDYLLVTHIDVDHIEGICNMLHQMPTLKIDHIIYNNPFAKKEENTQNEPLSEFEKEQIENLKTFIPKWKPKVEHMVAAKDILALSTLIQRNWTDAWDKKLKLISGEYLSLGEFGKMFIVSPTQTAIDELNNHILDEFARKFYKKYPLEQGKEKGAELFELLSLLYNQKDLLLENKISTSISTINAEYGKPDKEDTSKTNRASIAFAWELGNKKILLLGDATSEIVIEGIKAYKEKNQISVKEKIYFDAIKVPHHGSDANLSKELLKHIDSPNWIFCGCTSSAPHLHTIANIIYQPLSNTIKKRIMYFNSHYYKNNICEEMENKVQMLKEEGIEIEVKQINKIML